MLLQKLILTAMSINLILQHAPQQPSMVMIIRKSPKKMRPNAIPNKSSEMSKFERSTVPTPESEADSSS